MATIIIQSSPFQSSGRIIENVKQETLFIDWLKKSYPSGIKYPYEVRHNNKIVDVKNFDFKLMNGDVVNILFTVKNDVIKTAQDFQTKTFKFITSGAEQIQDAYNNIFNPPDYRDLLNNIKLPETPNSLKSRNNSPTYDFRGQGNVARIAESIPVQYGRLRFFPDLVMPIRNYYENNVLYSEYLLCLGHGQYQLHDIFIGDLSLNALISNQSISAVEALPSSYQLIDPFSSYSDYSPPSWSSFNDAYPSGFVDNAQSVNAMQSLDIPYIPSKLIRIKNSGYGWKLSFNKTNRTITVPDGFSFNSIFEDGDTLVIDDVSTGGFNGEYEVESVDSDVQLTVTSSASWPATGDHDGVVYNKKDKKVLNVSGTFPIDYSDYFFGTPQFLLKNDDLDDFSFEIDFEFKNGLFSYNETDDLGVRAIAYRLFIVPALDDGTPLDLVVKYKTNGSYPNGVELTSISSTVYEFNEDIVEDDGTYSYPNTLSITFYEDGTPIDPSDIDSIDYVNNRVTFLTSKTGTITCLNFLYTLGNKAHAGVTVTLSAGTRDSFRDTKRALNVFTRLTDIEYPITTYFYLSIHPTTYLENQKNYFPGMCDASINVKILHPNIDNYGPYTLLALKIKSDAEITALRENNIAIVATRKLSTWNGTSWSVPTATRSIAWALADVYMSAYGGNQPASKLDLDALLALDTTLDARGDYCDIRFDSFSDVLSEITNVARLGRCKPVFENDFLTFVRDEAKENRVALFTPANIIDGSFQIEYHFNDDQEPDGIKVLFQDETDDYKENYALSSSNSTRAKEVTLTGCTQYSMAWREAKFLDAQMRNIKSKISFETELEGLILQEYDRIAIAHDVPSWGQFGLVRGKYSTTITLSEPVTFGVGDHYILFRTRSGGVSGPHLVTAGATSKEVILDTDVEDITFFTDPSSTEMTYYSFGTISSIVQDAIVTRVQQSGQNRVSVECIEYVPSVYSADSGTPDAQPDALVAIDTYAPRLSGLTLSNVPNSGEVVAVWNKAFAGSEVDSYEIEKSSDGSSWSTVASVSSPTNTYTISSTGLTYVRIKTKVGANVGPWSSSSIVAS